MNKREKGYRVRETAREGGGKERERERARASADG